MYTHAHKHNLPLAELFRWFGRISAATLVGTWFVFVVLELLRSGPPTAAGSAYQAGILAVVFIGYAIGWRAELVGGLVAVLGTLAFFVENMLTVGVLPRPEAILFAVPGILFLLAWEFEGRPRVKWLRKRAKRY